VQKKSIKILLKPVFCSEIHNFLIETMYFLFENHALIGAFKFID
jgi:hypothetical protein